MNTFKHWSKSGNYHRWYFDDGSYIEASRPNNLHRWKFRTKVLKDTIAEEEFMFRNNTPLMESIYLITDIDFTL